MCLLMLIHVLGVCVTWKMGFAVAGSMSITLRGATGSILLQPPSETQHLTVTLPTTTTTKLSETLLLSDDDGQVLEQTEKEAATSEKVELDTLPLDAIAQPNTVQLSQPKRQ